MGGIYFQHRVILLACRSTHHLLKEKKFHFVKFPLLIQNKKVFLSIDPPKIMVLSFIPLIFLFTHSVFFLFLLLVNFSLTLVHASCYCLNIIWLIKKLMKFVCYRFSQRLFKKETPTTKGDMESAQTRLLNHLCGHQQYKEGMGDCRDDSFDSTTGSQIFCNILWSLEWDMLCVFVCLDGLRQIDIDVLADVPRCSCFAHNTIPNRETDTFFM